MFRYAMRHGLVDANPFETVPTNSIATERFSFVSAEDAAKVLEELPDCQWWLLFALSRWGGLRVGSEVRRLTWDDIDWQRQRFTVCSPKTEHHQGGGSRTVPIFPELAKLLDERYAQAEEGETLVLPMLAKCTDTALRQLLVRAIVRAGVQPWPRPWHNMRATRQTELADRFPGHVVCNWLGNSETTAIKHYLRVRDDHFDKAAQNAAQSMHEQQRRAPQANWADNPKPLEKQAHATTCKVVHGRTVVREGLEPPTKGL
ncbi:MAG: site-specific integrase [Planctomycetes bacterium]|nr:site-specific integrase [Planctomycetota bacterium]